MTKEELLEVFDWSEKNANQNNLLYFKLLDNNQIGGYFKESNKHFADFFINSILNIVRSEKKC